jgi:Zn-dependent peptidase ImmA (M78 family)
VPYITCEVLDGYAEAVIRDAAPDALSAPVPIDAEMFVEFYLGLNIEFKRLSRDRRILGMTVFNDGVVLVTDEDGRTQTPLEARAGTVFIDPLLIRKCNAARRRFTMMHEASHWLILREAFSEDNPFGSPGVFENRYIAAKTGRVDYSRSRLERTDHERIERQADFLASALLMPKTTLRMAFKEFFAHRRERPRALVRGKSEADDNLARLLPEFVADRFGVSKRAALIRLEKLNAVTGSPRFG